MEHTAIMRIHQAANNAAEGCLDDEVHLSRLTMLSWLSAGEEYKSVVVNVPLKRVISVSRDDLYKPRRSWRELTYQLHGDDWQDDVFDYFDSEMEDCYFPAPSSLSDLPQYMIGYTCSK